ncbi:MAG: hypothetical protein JRD89_17555 [Deltaproteobacteria bacterium]|nr:hypothetical protein [Deltaproteobacteria bacterium]
MNVTIAVKKKEYGLVTSASWCDQTVVGLDIIGEPTFTEWDELGAGYGAARSSLPFLIGDWINYGRDNFETWAQATRYFPDHTSQTLANYASVCRAVPFHIRRWELSFSHHQHVRALSERLQIKELAFAVEYSIGSEYFRLHIGDTHGKKKVQNNRYLRGLRKANIDFAALCDHAPLDQLDLLRDIGDKISKITDDYMLTLQPDPPEEENETN